MRITEVMNKPVHTVTATDDAAFAWEQMDFHQVQHLVVVDSDGRMIGIVSASDVGGRRGEPLRVGRRVADVMTEKVVAVTPDTTVREAANLMRGHRVNCLPVFERGQLKGIVTALDLLELLGRGAERPVTTAKRRILKDRGQVPHQAAPSKPPRGRSSVIHR